MALFNIPNRPGRSLDNKVAKKAKVTKKSSGTVVRGGNDLLSKINEAKALVQSKLGQYADDFCIITEFEDLVNYIDACIDNNYVSIDTETDGLDPLVNKLAGICIYTYGQKGAYIPINHISYITHEKVDGQLPLNLVISEFTRLVHHHPDIDMFNAKFDIRVLRANGLKNIYCTWDGMLASFILNENEPSHGLKQLHKKYCLNGKGDAFSFDTLFDKIPFTMVPFTTGYLYAAHDPVITTELCDYQRKYLRLDSEREDIRNMAWVFHNIEMPCLPVVCDMEDTGVAFDLEYQKKLSVKYNELLEEKTQAFYKACDMYGKEIEAYKKKNADHKLDNPINMGSPKQLATLFYDILKLKSPDKKSPRGTGEEILKKLDNPIAKAVLEYRTMAKLVSTYIDKLPDCVNPNDGRIHCSFLQYGARTGRFACISEGSLVSSPAGDKPIQNMEPGDWVYCYDDNNQLTLSKVKNVWYNGERDCVRLKWRSKYNAELVGELICTPDHFIRTERGWVMAKNLTPDDSILYVHRRIDNHNIALYGWKGQGHEEEHTWIKQYYFNVPDTKLNLHHVDGNHTNNSPDNLTVVAAKVHNNCHRHDGIKEQKSYGKGYNWTEEELLVMGESVNWELTKLGFDYESIIRWYRNYRINYIQKFTESYSTRNYVIRPNDKAHKALHLPLNKSNLQYALELSCGNTVIAAGYFGVALKKFEQACDKHQLLSNHNIVSIEYLDTKFKVYDLEVEKYHNFIANELCVHNCSDPNLQNIPSHNKDIRKMFKATDGYVLMSSDYSQQEPKLMSQLCQDKKMIKAYQEGKDLYAEIAALSFNTTYDNCLEFRPDGTTNPEGKERRSQAKSILLGVLYGRGVPSIAEQLGVSTKKAQAIKDSVFKGFPAIPKFEEDSLEMGEDLGYVTTLWGRKRRLPEMQLPEFEFAWKDGAPLDDDLLDFDDMNAPEVNVSEVPEDIQEYYTKKLSKCWGSEKQEIIRQAKEEGILITDNGGKIADASRQCVNSRIQGSAADMSKLAMIKVGNDKQLKEWGFRLLIPVHDELIGECPEKYAKECSQRFAQLMSEAAADKLTIPIRCDVEVTRCWYGEKVDI